MSEDSVFDTEFTTDEQVEEMIDSLVLTVGEMIAADERKTSVLNPIKLKQIEFAYKALRYMTKGTKTKVSYVLHEPYNSMGFVSVIGNDVQFNHPEWLVKIAECASNVEMYPRTDNKIQMNFTFHGLTSPIE